MCKSITLLSGKGGSGKTSLALSMASLLSKCGIKILLIDCDLSTNGATYFYEDKIPKNLKRISSFYNIIFGNDKNHFDKKVMSINDCYDFMPSLEQINADNTKSYSFAEEDIEKFFSFYEYLKQMYDVIIFDCQAGYTDLLKLILPNSDINLVVMEADAISSSAIRSLYLKIGSLVDDKKIYQVFNKATNEEYELYSKLSGVTFFTNIETIKFDWTIRKDFSLARVPDLENISMKYGKQIYNICEFLFKEAELETKLKKFKDTITINEKKEIKADLEKRIIKMKHSSLGSVFKNIQSLNILFIPILIMFSTFFVFLINKNYDYSILSYLSITFFVFTVVYLMLNLGIITKNKRLQNKEIKNYENELKTTQLEIKQLKNQTNDIKTKRKQ